MTAVEGFLFIGETISAKLMTRVAAGLQISKHSHSNNFLNDAIIETILFK